MNPHLSIVIPMYNEEKKVCACIEQLRSLMDRCGYPAEAVLVNDGSLDATYQEALKACQNDPRFILTGYEKNRGKGGAVRYGMMKASGDRIVYTDCDMAYGIESVIGIAEAAVKEKVDIMIGSRSLKGEDGQNGYTSYTPLRKLASKTYLRIIQFAAGFRHSDSQCGLKCYSREAAHKVFALCEINGFAFDLEALMIAEKAGFSIGEYPARIMVHDEKSSKVHIISDTMKMLCDIRTIRKRIRKLEIE